MAAKNQLNKLMTGLAGEYLVAGMMNLKGWVASLTLKNFPGVDIFGKDPKTDRNISVQVKTSRENSFNIGINRPQRKVLNELIKGPFVFVHIDKNNDVTYYILTKDEVIDLNMVQRMTDSGRRVRFAVTCIVGNGDGFIGYGRAKGKEVGPSIKKAIDNAKLNMIEIKRGCGSWQCGCGQAHSLPFEVSGRTGSVVVSLKPAPRGVSLAVGDVAKSLLTLAGVRDAWGFARGNTKTKVNYAQATFEALKMTSRMRVTDEQESRLNIVSGPTGITYAESDLEEREE